MSLNIYPACRRHVREARCPFCNVASRLVAAFGSVCLASCSGGSSNATPEATITSSVLPAAGMCEAMVQFLQVPTDAGAVDIACSVVPTGENYGVTLSAQSTGSMPSTLTISGTFTPRSRDDAGVANADDTQIPNITMELVNPMMDLRQTTCFAQYVNATNGQPGVQLPSVADTFADSNGGRIYASIFCESPQNLTESQHPGYSGCETSATFQFENCASH